MARKPQHVSRRRHKLLSVRLHISSALMSSVEVKSLQSEVLDADAGLIPHAPHGIAVALCVGIVPARGSRSDAVSVHSSLVGSSITKSTGPRSLRATWSEFSSVGIVGLVGA